MRANIVKGVEENASNGGASTIILCIDREIHLKVNESWYEKWGGNPEDINDERCWVQTQYCTELGPCDCGCGPSVELTTEHEAMIEVWHNRISAGMDPRLSLTEDRRGKKKEGTPHFYFHQRFRNFSAE